MTKLDDAFNKLGTDSSGAKSGLSGLRSKWGSLPFAERNGLMATMNVAAAQIGAIANAGDDPVGAVRGVINMVGALSVAAGPTGMIVNVALNFVSGLLSLFGIGGKKKQKTAGEIVREQIDEALDKYADRSLMEEAEGIMEMFDNSKAYVDSLVKHNRQLTVSEANHTLIPHGNHLYTIQNNYKCPSYRYCGQYVSFDIVNGKARATIEDDDPTLWEIYGHQQKR